MGNDALVQPTVISHNPLQIDTETFRSEDSETEKECECLSVVCYQSKLFMGKQGIKKLHF